MSKLNTKRRGSLPTKRSINLMGVGQKPLNLKVAIPAIILIVIAALLISKFAVVDRLIAVSEANRKLEDVNLRLKNGWEQVEEYGDLTTDYAQYTFSDMNEDELTRPDRVAVINMIRRVILPKVSLDKWYLTGATLNLTMSADSLTEINQVVRELEQEALVKSCTMDSYEQQGNEEGRVQHLVTANYTVKLNPREEVGWQ